MSLSEDEIFEEGLGRIQAGDLEGAEKLLLQLPPGSSLRGEAMLALGRMYVDTGHVDEAVACLLESSLHLREPRSFKELGDCLMLLERFEEAERALLEVVHRDPGDAEAWAMLGRAFVSQDLVAQGIGYLERAIALDGGFAPARYYLADALIREGDTVRASGQLHMLLVLEPGHLGGIVLKGDLAWERGEMRQAIAEYERAAGLGALSADGYVRLGAAYERVGDEAGAVEAYDRALARDPHLPQASIAIARICEKRKLYKRARRYYRAIVHDEALGDDAAAGIGRIDAYFRHFDLSGEGQVPQGDEDEPLDSLSRGEPAKPNTPPPPGRFGRRT